MSVHGKAIGGKQERRKEIAQIAMMHPARLRRPDDLRPHQPLLSRPCSGASSSTARPSSTATPPASPNMAWPTTWPTDQARLAVDTRGLPAADLRSPQGRHASARRLSLQGQSRRQRRLVDESQDGRSRRLHRLSPAAKVVLPSTSTRKATHRRRCCPPSKIGWRTGTSCRNSQGCAE